MAAHPDSAAQARPDVPLFDQEPLLREAQAGTVGRTRAFVKVQDGCNNRCTFCVTTLARGEGRSRHLGDVVAEFQAMAAAGYLPSLDPLRNPYTAQVYNYHDDRVETSWYGSGAAQVEACTPFVIEWIG